METLNTVTKPSYELRAKNLGVDNLELEIWQMPCVATPHVKEPIHIASLKGRNMSFVERQVLTRLHTAGVAVGPAEGSEENFTLDEDLALRLGLLFRLLAPMRNAERMRTIASRIDSDSMTHAEMSYWMGMVMHRSKPRRILCALRIILTDPE